MFGRDDFAAIADRLATIKGRFVVSLNDRPEVREVFGKFDLHAVDTTYSVAGPMAKSRRAAELLITSNGLLDSI